MTRRGLTRLLVLALVAWGAYVASPAGPAGADSPGCRWSHRGFAENRWLGGAGPWSDATRWSLGVVPGTAAHDYACIPAGSEVVVDLQTPQVDLEILELGRDATLTLEPGTSMFVWGDQTSIRSITKRGSLIRLNGATLGGGGRLHVIGTLDVHPSSTGVRSVVTTSPTGSSYAGPPGILEIGDEGLLDVHGSRDLRISSHYVVDVHGKARLRGGAGLLADRGTTMLLQKHYYGPGVGKLVILNDGDFAQNDAGRGSRPATLVNRGRIVKIGAGLTSIEGRYFGLGKTSGHCVGPCAMLIPPLLFQNKASSGTNVSPSVPQVASLLFPVAASDGATAQVEPLDGQGVKGAVGVPMKVHASGLAANVADPAVIELRYDTALFGGGGSAADPTTLVVGHADGAGEPYDDIPTCLGRGGLPLGAFACVDRLASRVVGTTLVMVVRTIDTSRWIVR